jgi:hypothetical protein
MVIVNPGSIIFVNINSTIRAKSAANPPAFVTELIVNYRPQGSPETGLYLHAGRSGMN